ncbi:MAG: hypothetical protein IT462_02655 [Planctomycetes bacterium]|nr:hypothetical protein [Planctomycetota bacterium]
MRVPLGSLLLIGFATCILASVADAHTIDPIPTEKLLHDADFVGIVECTKAGGIVAEYKVVQSWRGPKAGDTVRIKIAANYWGPQYPLVLVGERLGITGFKTKAPSTLMSMSSGAPIPEFWRQVRFDFSLPLFQGRWPVEKSASVQEDPKNPTFESQAKEFFGHSPSKQEALILAVVTSKRLLRGKLEDEAETIAIQLVANMRAANDCAAALKLLVAYAKDAKKEIQSTIAHVLKEAGYAETVSYLKRMDAKDLPWNKDKLTEIQTEIDGRLHPKDQALPQADEQTIPDAKKLAALRKIVESGDIAHEDFGEAVETLTRYEPAPVAKWLKDWTQDKNAHWSAAEKPYLFGSFFGHSCGKDRISNLITLLDAKEQGVRVAAAVYLCFDDAVQGEKALKEFAKLEGRPGAWAGLTLVRRGHKEYFPRAIKFLHFVPETGMSGTGDELLQQKILELLSNSAAKSGIAQPVTTSYVRREEMQFGTVVDVWWEKYKDKIIPFDPWAEELSANKTD